MLAEKSDFFRAMFTTDMKEANSKFIKLPENAQVLTSLFQLVYGLEITENINKIMQLIIAAKKYLMLDIHQECLETLDRLVTLSNSVNVLIFCHENDLEALKQKILIYVVEYDFMF